MTAASVGILPDQFWGRPDDISTGLSLRELDLFVRGYHSRLEVQQQLLAWHAANLMNMWAKKGSKVTPDKLLGKEERQLDPQELAAELAAESRRLERKNDLTGQLTASSVSVEDQVEDLDHWIAQVIQSTAAAYGDDTLDDEEA